MHYRRKAQPFNRDDQTSAAGESRRDGAHSVAHEVSAGESRRNGAHSVANEVSAGESRRENAGFDDSVRSDEAPDHARASRGATGRTSEAKFATARR